jgi:hypothetical protein
MPSVVDDYAPTLKQDVSIVPDYHFDLGAKAHVTVEDQFNGDTMAATRNGFREKMTRSMSDPGIDILSCSMYFL